MVVFCVNVAVFDGNSGNGSGDVDMLHAFLVPYRIGSVRRWFLIRSAWIKGKKKAQFRGWAKGVRIFLYYLLHTIIYVRIIGTEQRN